MASDLEKNLVLGGISPAAAKVIANAIDNAASSRLDIGRRYGDATPTSQMRMIDGDSRKYVFDNLDQPRDGRFRRGQRSPSNRYSPRDTSHSYDRSQPATGPTLTTPAVADGQYMTATPAATNAVAQSKVELKVTKKGGNHARLNPATGAVEAVPFLVECDQEQFIEAKVEERADGTVLKLRLRNLEKLFTVNVVAKQPNGTVIPDLIEGSMVPNDNGGITLNLTLKNLKATQGLNPVFDIWAFNR